MKKLLHILLCTCAVSLFAFHLSPAAAQQVEYVDDEECGCSLVFVDGIQTTQDGDRFGFKRSDGTVIAENIYRYVDQFHGDYCKVYLDDRQCGLIDRNGRVVVACIYDDVEYPSCGRVLVNRDSHIGYCNLDGQEVIPPIYPYGGSFSEGLAQVVVPLDSLSAAFAYIDTSGRQVLQPIYENAMPFHDGYAMVMRYQRWGVIDRNGREVLPCMYERATVNSNGYFFAGDIYGMALFNYRFKPLTDFIYNSVGDLADGRFAVERDELYGFIDTLGRQILPCIYDEVSRFYLNRAMVRFNDRYGIVDTAGRFVLPLEYTSTTTHGYKYVYRDSLAMVEKDRKLGFVDLDGNLVIPFYFENGFHFTQGYACMQFNGRWGYINTKGDIYIPFIFDHASPFSWGRAEVIYNGTVSNMDLRGKCVKNCNGVIAWRDWTKDE